MTKIRLGIECPQLFLMVFLLSKKHFYEREKKTKEIQVDCIANGLVLDVEGELGEIEDINPHQNQRGAW